MSILKVGVIQSTPVLFDLERSMEKLADLVNERKNMGFDVLLFPESYLPGYPRGLTFGTVVGKRSDHGKAMFRHFAENSVEVPGPHTEFLGKLAKSAGTYLAVGVTERDRVNGTLYCTLLYFGPGGDLLGKHRKIKPTAAERIIWGEGDGSTLVTLKTDFGVLGGLICWENYMPLARMSMYRKGVQVYLAPTADDRETWQSTLRHIALEGRCFVLGCNQFIRNEDYPGWLRQELSDEAEIMCRGGSVIIDPSGKVLAGPLFDKEGFLEAEVDMDRVKEGKMDFDVVGHYARDDIFRLVIDGQPETRDLTG